MTKQQINAKIAKAIKEAYRRAALCAREGGYGVQDYEDPKPLRASEWRERYGGAQTITGGLEYVMLQHLKEIK